MKKMNISKILAFLLSVTAALTACDLPAATENPADNVVEHGTEPVTENVTETLSPTIKLPGEMRDITSMELTSEMTVGWNLGNCLDVCIADRDGDGMVNETPENGAVDETLWGNAKATPELFDIMKSEGVNAVRIPVTWRDHLGEAPDYKIDEEWLSRVNEVVDYAISRDMYAIINIHHDGGDDAKFGAWVRNAAKDYDGFNEKYTALWNQICERFKDYPDKLIFESANEIGFDNLSKNEAYELLNKINSRFVEIVRTSGGNNDKRHLLIAGYWTDISETCDSRFVLPDDPAGRLIVSVHYYTPWQFCITGDIKTWGSDSDISELNNKMSLLKRNFIDNGIPVLIGEYGFAGTTSPQSQIKFSAAVTKTCHEMGIPCFLWDDGGIINRENFLWRNPDLMAGIRKSIEE